MFEYWFMLPIAVVVASLATGSGFGGGILFFPIFIYGLGLNVPEAVGTGMVTELCGMTSAMICYVRQKQVEFEICFPMIIVSFPSLLFGLHIIQLINPAYPKMFFGLVVISCAVWVLMSIRSATVNTKSHFLIEHIIPYLWVPFFGGLSSGITSVGTAETILPLMERKLKLEIHRAIATTVMVEGAVGWLATAINIWEGQIRWDIAAYTMTGVIIGGNLGPYVSSYISDKTLKIIFAFFVIFAGVHMIMKNIFDLF